MAWGERIHTFWRMLWTTIMRRLDTWLLTYCQPKQEQHHKEDIPTMREPNELITVPGTNQQVRGTGIYMENCTMYVYPHPKGGEGHHLHSKELARYWLAEPAILQHQIEAALYTLIKQGASEHEIERKITHLIDCGKRFLNDITLVGVRDDTLPKGTCLPFPDLFQEQVKQFQQKRNSRPLSIVDRSA